MPRKKQPSTLVRLTPEAYEALDRLCAEKGLSRSAVLSAAAIWLAWQSDEVFSAVYCAGRLVKNPIAPQFIEPPRFTPSDAYRRDAMALIALREANGREDEAELIRRYGHYGRASEELREFEMILIRRQLRSEGRLPPLSPAELAKEESRAEKLTRSLQANVTRDFAKWGWLGVPDISVSPKKASEEAVRAANARRPYPSVPGLEAAVSRAGKSVDDLAALAKRLSPSSPASGDTPSVLPTVGRPVVEAAAGPEHGAESGAGGGVVSPGKGVTSGHRSTGQAAEKPAGRAKRGEKPPAKRAEKSKRRTS